MTSLMSWPAQRNRIGWLQRRLGVTAGLVCFLMVLGSPGARAAVIPGDEPNGDGVQLLQDAVAAYEGDDATEYERLYALAERGGVWLPTLAVQALRDEEIGDVVEWYLALEEDDAGFVAIAIDILAIERDSIADMSSGEPTPEQVDTIIEYDSISASMLEVLDHRSIEVSGETRLVLTSIIANGATPVNDDYSRGLDDLDLLYDSLSFNSTQAPGDIDSRTIAPDSNGGVPTALLATGLIAACALAVGLLAVRRTMANGHLADIAFTDSLTGLHNRRRLDQDLARHREGIQQSGDRPVATLMVDVDNFKQVNDAHGHSVGDEVLRLVGATLHNEFRQNDVPYRYGGEEFCVLLADTTRDEAAAAAERARRAIEAIDPPIAGRITVSVGVSMGPAADITNTLQRADDALFSAKAAGRNRVATN